jgi:hypothetical protein
MTIISEAAKMFAVYRVVQRHKPGLNAEQIISEIELMTDDAVLEDEFAGWEMKPLLDYVTLTSLAAQELIDSNQHCTKAEYDELVDKAWRYDECSK